VTPANTDINYQFFNLVNRQPCCFTWLRKVSHLCLRGEDWLALYKCTCSFIHSLVACCSYNL